MDTTPGATPSFLDYVSRAGVITLLILIVFGGYRKWWVFGWAYAESEKRNDKLKDECDSVRDEKDAWRETALKSANVATQAFETIQQRRSDERR